MAETSEMKTYPASVEIWQSMAALRAGQFDIGSRLGWLNLEPIIIHICRHPNEARAQALSILTY